MSTFTPGPWTYYSDNGYGDTRFYITQSIQAPYTAGYSDVGTVICETVSGERKPVQEANARLIAAAPELLALAKMFVEDYDPIENTPESSFGQLVTEARALISKATGQ